MQFPGTPQADLGDNNIININKLESSNLILEEQKDYGKTFVCDAETSPVSHHHENSSTTPPTLLHGSAHAENTYVHIQHVY